MVQTRDKFDREFLHENLYAWPRYINWLVILIINGLVNYNIIRKEKVNFINAHQTKFDNDKILAAWQLQFHLLNLVRLESK